MSGFSSHKPMTQNRIRLEDEVKVFKGSPQFQAIRLIGPHVSFVQIWFDIITKDGKKVSIPKVCLDYDPKSESFTRDICPYRASGVGKIMQRYLTNVIVRNNSRPRQVSRLPEEKKPVNINGVNYYFMAKGSSSWTPCEVWPISPSLVQRFQDDSQLNKVKGKDGSVRTFDVDHPRFGRDYQVKYNANASPADRWRTTMDERTPLTEEEQRYLLFNLFKLESIKPQTLDEARRDFNEIKRMLVNKPEKNADSNSVSDDDSLPDLPSQEELRSQRRPLRNDDKRKSNTPPNREMRSPRRPENGRPDGNRQRPNNRDRDQERQGGNKRRPAPRDDFEDAIEALDSI